MYERTNALKGKYLKNHDMLISMATPEAHEVMDLCRLFNIIFVIRTYKSMT